MSVINVTRSSMPEFEEYIEEIRPLWESRFLTNMGEKHHELERKLKDFLTLLRLRSVRTGILRLRT